MTYKSSECEWTGYPCSTSREPRANRDDICNIEANHAEGEDRRRCSIPGKGEEAQESCNESSGPGTRDRRLRSWVYVIEPIGEWESAVPGKGKRLSRRSKKLHRGASVKPPGRQMESRIYSASSHHESAKVPLKLATMICKYDAGLTVQPRQWTIWPKCPSAQSCCTKSSASMTGP